MQRAMLWWELLPFASTVLLGWSSERCIMLLCLALAYQPNPIFSSFSFPSECVRSYDPTAAMAWARQLAPNLKTASFTSCCGRAASSLWFVKHQELLWRLLSTLHQALVGNLADPPKWVTERPSPPQRPEWCPVTTCLLIHLHYTCVHAVL